MATYITRRLIQTIGLLFLLSILLFGMVNLAPGGPLAGQGQSRHIPPAKAAILKRQFGLDKPLPVQYVIWLAGNDWMKVDTNGDGIPDGVGTRKGILRGDFGFSFRTRRPVLDEINLRFPNTIYLMSITFIIALALAIPIGILSATRQYSIFDIIATTFSFAGQALPEFWLGLIMILVFYAWLKNPFTGAPLLPSGGMSSRTGSAISSCLWRQAHWVGSHGIHASCVPVCLKSCLWIICALPAPKVCPKDSYCIVTP